MVRYLSRISGTCPYESQPLSPDVGILVIPPFLPPQSHSCLEYFTCRDAAFLGYKVSNFIVTFQEKGGKKWEYDEFFFQNQENAGERGSIAALRELSQPDQERQSIFLENKVNDFST